jgi:hypothetical protein
MAPRTVLLLALLLAPPLAGCAADADTNGSSRAKNAQNPNPAPTGIGPNAGIGLEPRDMAGGGRGSTTPRGK